MSFYLMHRGWRDHHLFKDQPYSDGEAWEHLIATANFTPGKYRQANKIYDIPRGDIATSYRTLSEKWKWSTGKAIRFLKLLLSEGMISIKTEHNFLQITLTNYETYQNPLNQNETGIDTETKPKRNQNETKIDTNVKKDKELKELKEEVIPPVPEWMPDEQWDAFKKMRRKIKKPMTAEAEKIAIGKLDRWRGLGHDPTEILNYSIMNGYPGLYEPKENTHAKPSGNTTSDKSKWASAAEHYIAKHAQPAG